MLHVDPATLTPATWIAPALTALIERHRLAYKEYYDACLGSDEIAVAQAGGDTSTKAMAPAHRRLKRAYSADHAAWDALLLARPTSLTDLHALTAYITSTVRSSDDHGPNRDLVVAIARQINDLCAPSAAHPNAELDPVFEAIEMCRAAEVEHDRLHAICGNLPDAAPEWEPERVAHKIYWTLFTKCVLKTSPTTLAGCRALASFVRAFLDRQGVCCEDYSPIAFAAIAGEAA